MLWNGLRLRRIEVLLAKANELQHLHDVGKQDAIELCAFGELALSLVDDGDLHLCVVAGICALQLRDLVRQQNWQAQLDAVECASLANHIHQLVQQREAHLIGMHLRVETHFVLKDAFVRLHFQSNVICERGNRLT